MYWARRRESLWEVKRENLIFVPLASRTDLDDGSLSAALRHSLFRSDRLASKLPLVYAPGGCSSSCPCADHPWSRALRFEQDI